MSLTGTVSLLHNNLACSTGGWAACIHNSVNAGGGKLLLNKTGGPSKDVPDIGQAMSLCYLELATGPVLVVCSTNGTRIYNEDATSMLVYIPMNDPGTETETLKHHQGACLVPALGHIVIGTSTGSLVPVDANASYDQVGESMPSAPTQAVADVCFNEMTNLVVSAHHNGELRIWQVNQAGPYQNASVVPPAMGQAPVRVASLGARLLVAYGPGTLCLFDAVTYDCQVELTAHARWVTAVDVREDLGFVATVGEDTVLNVWQVDASTGRIGLLQSSVVTDKLLTGAAMHGSEVMVTAYDSGELYRVGL